MNKIWIPIFAATLLATTAPGMAQSSAAPVGKQVQTQKQKQVKEPRGTQNRNRTQVKDGKCTGDPTGAQGSRSRKGRTLGPGDGTGNTAPPTNGTGYGSPNPKSGNSPGKAGRGRRGGRG